MLHFRFNLIDPIDGKGSACFDFLRCILRNQTFIAKCFGDCELDIGRAAVFLASADASYINGHSLMVDGGQGMPL